VVTSGIQSTLVNWRENGVGQASTWDRLAQFEVLLQKLTAAQAEALVRGRLDAFLVPFANASYWHNFMNETHVDFVTATGTINATNFGPKDFMQYEVGVSATDTALGVVGFVKGTFRDGDAITGSAISAGGRINF